MSIVPWILAFAVSRMFTITAISSITYCETVPIGSPTLALRLALLVATAPVPIEIDDDEVEVAEELFLKSSSLPVTIAGCAEPTAVEDEEEDDEELFLKSSSRLVTVLERAELATLVSGFLAVVTKSIISVCNRVARHLNSITVCDPASHNQNNFHCYRLGFPNTVATDQCCPDC